MSTVDSRTQDEAQTFRRVALIVIGWTLLFFLWASALVLFGDALSGLFV